MENRMALTVRQIEAAKHGVQKERISDGSGLHLRPYPSGKKGFSGAGWQGVRVLAPRLGRPWGLS